MPNTHEYTFFDRSKLDRALTTKWSAADKRFSSWGQWDSARSFLTEWALGGDVSPGELDRIIANKTIGATLRSSGDQFSFLWGLLDATGLCAGGAEIPKGDHEYADEIVSCAGVGFSRGVLSLAGLTAVYHLHANWVEIAQVVPAGVANAVRSQPSGAPMLPGMPDLKPEVGNGLGVAQTRRFIDFLRRAWKGKWPLYPEGKTDSEGREGRTIRSCAVAEDLFKSVSRRHSRMPCVYRWYGC
ncbi:MAG: hypothetical protein C0467_27900 [Planctomycetaceae bacterium]|nr:hypothetical protein [Planctomycetaceae bacterium]